MHLSAILLAAGLSKRMGCDKLLMEYRGKTLIAYAIELLSGLTASRKIIVTTENRLEHIKPAQDSKVIINREPHEGQSLGVRLGVTDATGTHYLFLNADQPKLTVDDISPMLDIAALYPDKIIYPIINKAPCTPIIFPSYFREDLLLLEGDTGGRIIRDRHSDMCIEFTPEYPENFTDMDCKEDFKEGRVLA